MMRAIAQAICSAWRTLSPWRLAKVTAKTRKPWSARVWASPFWSCGLIQVLVASRMVPWTKRTGVPLPCSQPL
ncbi:hypothetical protein D3C86_2147780 [compost metagenome]